MARLIVPLSAGSAVFVALVLAGAAVAGPSAGASPTLVAPDGSARSLQVTAQRAFTIPDARLISMSPDGSWLVAASPATSYPRGKLCIYAVDTLAQRSCADLSELGAGLRIEDVAWAPDGRHLVFAEQTFMTFNDGDLWLMDAQTGSLTNLDDDGYRGSLLPSKSKPIPPIITIPVNPVFSPDGSTIVYSRSSIVDGAPTGDAIVSLPLTGGTPTVLRQVSTGELGVAYFGIAWAPDGSRIYYSITHADASNRESGIWQMSPEGDAIRLVATSDDPSIGPPAVAAVAPDGAHLLAFYPMAFENRAAIGSVYAVVDIATDAVTPVLPLDPATPRNVWVALAAFSPDGEVLATLERQSQPDFQVFLRDVGATSEVALLPQGLASAGPTARGIQATWATNGTLFLPGGASLDSGTLLTIGVRVPSPSASSAGPG